MSSKKEKIKRKRYRRAIDYFAQSDIGEAVNKKMELNQTIIIIQWILIAIMFTILLLIGVSVMSSKKEKLYQEELNTLIKAMDVREKPFILLKAWEEENGFVPAEYQKDHKFMSNYEAFKREGGWRNTPAIMTLLKKTAKLNVKNKL